MSWEIALVGGLVVVALGLFYLIGAFSKEHSMFKIFLFFIGLYFIMLNFSVSSNIVDIANITDGNSSNFVSYSNINDNVDTAYWLIIIVMWASLAYWFIYVIRISLEALRLRKVQKDTGEE